MLNLQSTTTTEPGFFERIGTAIFSDLANLGWFAIGIGIFALLAAIFHWRWVFNGPSHNTEKIEGISNIYGRGIARIYYGVIGIGCIAAGIIVLLLV